MVHTQETLSATWASTWVTSTFMADLVAAQDPHTVAEQIARQFRELTGAQTVVLLLHGDGSEACHVLACSPERRRSLVSGVVDRLCPCGWDIPLDRNPLAWRDVPVLAEKLGPARIGSLVSIPLVAGGDLVGAIVLTNLVSMAYVDEINKLMEYVGPLIALALQNAKSRQALQTQNLSLERVVQDRTAELAEANLSLRKSQMAALNMMEDAVLAKERLEVTQFALDHAADAVIWIEEDGSLAYANQAACDLLGYTIEELRELFVDQFCVDFSPTAWQEAKQAQASQFEGTWVTAAGVRVPVEVHASYMRYGEQEYVCSFVSDIRERKRSEQALAESRRRLQTLIDNLAGVAYRCAFNPQYTMELISDGITVLAGYAPEDISGTADLSYADIIHPNDRDMVWSSVARHVKAHKAYEITYRIITAQGATKWVWEQGRAVYDNDGAVVALEGLINDVTESVQQQEALVKSEEMFRSVLEQSPLAVAVYAPDGSLLRANGAWDRTFCHQQPYNILADPLNEELGIQDDILRAFLGHEVILEAFAYPATPRDALRDTQGEKWIRSRFSPLMEGDTMVSVLCTSEDLTEERRRDAEQRRLLSAIEQAAEAVIITNQAAEITYVSPAFEEITGYSAQEVLGRNPRLLQSGVHDDAFYEEMWRTLASGETWHGQLTNKRRDGSRYIEDAVIAPVLDPAGRIANYVAVKRDITQELRLAEQLRQAQKMEAVGRLAGGVAHDFNNMLSVILGHAEMLMLDLEDSDPIYPSLVEISQAGERSANLTRQLLAFARQQTVSPEVLDLNTAVSGMLRMLERLIGEDITLEWRPGIDLWMIHIDPSQIDQIMANLCVNARDAIADIGRITISTQNAVLDEAFCVDNVDATPGEYVQLRISDTGSGMEREVLAHLFEPFFTTKAVGKGTGLGLATVYGAVTQGGGCIDVHSQPGQGSTFDVYLPRHASREEALDQTAKADDAAGGQETILVVEDEPAILRMVAMMLKGMGYRVLPSSTPMEAIVMADRYDGTIDLLLTDVVMPEMNGRDLARRLQRSHPRLKCMFMSGYTADVIAHHGVLDSNVAFLAKPYTSAQLGQAVRVALESTKRQ